MVHVEEDRPIMGRGFEIKPAQLQRYLLPPRGLDWVLLSVKKLRGREDLKHNR